jgi:hypothetical protein
MREHLRRSTVQRVAVADLGGELLVTLQRHDERKGRKRHSWKEATDA